MLSRRVLVARADNLGDVLLTGPAVRAVAASGAEVLFLCGPAGRPAAEALPGVRSVLCCRLPWIEGDPEPVARRGMDALVDSVSAAGAEEAIVFTSFHQSPLPLALLLRMAGVAKVSAISIDYPGSLLDVRHRVPDDIHEVERALSLAAAAGYPAPPGDDRRLRVRADHVGTSAAPFAPGSYVVVHPGASVKARTWPPASNRELVARLGTAGWPVVVTGGRGEIGLAHETAASATGPVACLAGRTDFATLAATVAGAAALVCGNTGPAHLAAAVGTPVVSLYAPTVPAVRWRPWMVPTVLLGEQDIACAGCRARECPVPGHPCLAGVTPAAVVDAVGQLAPVPAGTGAA